MRWRRVAARPAIWLPIASFLLALLVLPLHLPPPRNTLAAWSFGLSAVGFIAPLFAAAAAWEAARLSAGGLTALPAARYRIWVACRPVLPLLASAVTVVAVVCVTHAGWPQVSGAQVGSWFAVTGGAVALLVAMVLVGAAVGHWLRPVAAPAVALLVSYLWLALPGGISEPVWARHLVALFDTCCDAPAVLSSRAVIGALAVTVGLGSAALVLASMRARWPAALLAASLLVAGFAVGIAQVRVLDHHPLAPRVGEMSCHDSTGFTLCVWPEHESQIPAATPTLSAATAALRTVGVQVPELITEQVGVSDAIEINLGPGFSPEGLTFAVVFGAHPGFDGPDCAHEGDTGWPAAPLASLAFDWLEATVTGAEPAEDSLETQALGRLLEWPVEQQGDWFHGVVAVMQTCDEPHSELWP